MPATHLLAQREAGPSLLSTLSLAERSIASHLNNLAIRVNVPLNRTSPPGLIQANTVDPFKFSWKYGIPWVAFPFGMILLTFIFYFFHFVTDGVRQSSREARMNEEVYKTSYNSSPSTEYEMATIPTDKSTRKFFPRSGHLSESLDDESPSWDNRYVHMAVASFRYFFYRPAPQIRLRKGWRPIELPTLTTVTVALIACVLSALIIFLPQPLYWQSIAYGSPPVAIRSGMMAIALVPWIVALAMKANIISLATGIGHERLNVLHRWGGYLCLLLSLIHTIPFYLQKLWDPNGFAIYRTYFNTNGLYFFGTGIAALAPLGFLCIHSLPILRRKAYELFAIVHVPVAIAFIAMLFWHTKNALATYDYLYATIAIWLTALVARLWLLNWARPWRLSWLIGEDSTVTMLPENAVKVTIPTQMKWKPGQYVYLRMPGVAIFENHPFTISSLCSDDLPSEYGEEYKDLVLVFRPFGGFTKQLMDRALEKGPYHTYRAFVDGPYGGMKRKLAAFDKVILIAGGSGITAIVSHLLDLIKRMRDGKAITTSVHVIWAMKRPETLEWFKEELRICRECAPPEAVTCQFFITAAKRLQPRTYRMTAQTTQQHISTYFRDHINDAFQGIADKRASYVSKRNSAYIRDEADGDIDYEKALRDENEDTVSALPRAHVAAQDLLPSSTVPGGIRNFSHPLQSDSPTDEPEPDRNSGGRDLTLDIQTALDASVPGTFDPSALEQPDYFGFGFPSTPTEFQKNLMRFAFLPAATRTNDGWGTEYGRPDLPFMLREMGDEFGRRTCVFVCGPPEMRVAVSRTVAEMQRLVLGNNGIEEIFLHTENYAL
jgi:predicted ferric reductase